MKRLLWSGVAALTLLASNPTGVFAWGTPEEARGYGFLGAFAMRCFGWIHQPTPLFNYGPYNLNDPGYVRMHIPRPHTGDYYPAQPGLWGPPTGGPYAQYAGDFGPHGSAQKHVKNYLFGGQQYAPTGGYAITYPGPGVLGGGQPTGLYPGGYPGYQAPMGLPTGGMPALPPGAYPAYSPTQGVSPVPSTPAPPPAVIPSSVREEAHSNSKVARATYYYMPSYVSDAVYPTWLTGR